MFLDQCTNNISDVRMLLTFTNNVTVMAVKPNAKEEKSIMGESSRRLSYSQVVSITDNFQTMIGKGGFGSVYSGRLSDGTQVAVKMLSSPSVQGSKQCWTEATFFILALKDYGVFFGLVMLNTNFLKA